MLCLWYDVRFNFCWTISASGLKSLVKIAGFEMIRGETSTYRMSPEYFPENPQPANNEMILTPTRRQMKS